MYKASAGGGGVACCNLLNRAVAWPAECRHALPMTQITKCLKSKHQPVAQDQLASQAPLHKHYLLPVLLPETEQGLWKVLLWVDVELDVAAKVGCVDLFSSTVIHPAKSLSNGNISGSEFVSSPPCTCCGTCAMDDAGLAVRVDRAAPMQSSMWLILSHSSTMAVIMPSVACGCALLHLAGAFCLVVHL